MSDKLLQVDLTPDFDSAQAVRHSLENDARKKTSRFPSSSFRSNRGRGRNSSRDAKPYKRPESKPSNKIQETVRRPSSMVKPLLRRFPIWVGDIGSIVLSRVIYHAMEGRDNRMANLVTQDQLLYVTVLGFWYRVVACGIEFGYNLNSPEYSALKKVVRHIYYPLLTRKYLLSIGEVKLPSGAVVTPLTCTLEEADRHVDIITPQDVLNLAGRPIPNNYWGIDYQWIQDWNMLTTRASRSALGFNLLDTSLEGKNEFLCSYRPYQYNNGLIEPLAPCEMPDQELCLGAAFRYRNVELVEQWQGNTNYLVLPTHTSENVEYEQLLSDRVVAEIVS